MASWLVRSSPDRAVRVQALAVDIVLCAWARHLTLTVPLSTQVYKWVPANLMLGVSAIRGNPETGDKRRPDGPLGSYAGFTLELFPLRGEKNFKSRS